jgi:hypothetical protein
MHRRHVLRRMGRIRLSVRGFWWTKYNSDRFLSGYFIFNHQGQYYSSTAPNVGRDLSKDRNAQQWSDTWFYRAVEIETPFFWDVTSRCWVSGYRSFERTYCLQSEGSCWPKIIETKERRQRVLRNVGSHSPNNASRPRHPEAFRISGSTRRYSNGGS